MCWPRQGTSTGLASLGGGIISTRDESLAAVAGSFAFVPQFQAWAAVAGDPAPTPDTAGANGGWRALGSMQTTLPPAPAFGKAASVEIASYTIGALALGQGTLTFQPGEVQGYLLAETDAGSVIGATVPTTVTVLLPEPAGLALLALSEL